MFVELDHDARLQEAAIAGEPLFEPRLQRRQHRAQREIDQRRLDIEDQRLIGRGDDALRRLEQFRHGDGGGKRGVLDQRDEGVGQRRHGDAAGLRQDGAAHRLRPGHADRIGGFPLALGHRGDDGADDLGGIGADIEREADQRRRKGIEHDADARQAVEDQEQLHQQRRAADDPDIEAHDGASGAGPNSRSQRGDQARPPGRSAKESSVSGTVKSSAAHSSGGERLEHQVQPVRHERSPCIKAGSRFGQIMKNGRGRKRPVGRSPCRPAADGQAVTARRLRRNTSRRSSRRCRRP